MITDWNIKATRFSKPCKYVGFQEKTLHYRIADYFYDNSTKDLALIMRP
jgi:hypothetical protein